MQWERETVIKRKENVQILKKKLNAKYRAQEIYKTDSKIRIVQFEVF